jgi:hypothetical protein
MAKEGLQVRVGLIVKQASLVADKRVRKEKAIQHVGLPRHNVHQQLKRKQGQQELVGKRKRMVAL